MYRGLSETDEGYIEKALETGIYLHRVPAWGNWKGAHLPGTLRDR